MSLADFPTWHIRSPKVLRRLGHRKDDESVPWWKVCENNVDNDYDAIRQMDELGSKTYNNVVTEIDDGNVSSEEQNMYRYQKIVAATVM